VAFRIGGGIRRSGPAEAAAEADHLGLEGPEPVDAVRPHFQPAADQPLAGETRREPAAPTVAEIDRIFVQVFALVGEAIAGATHALLAGDREAAKQLVQRDEMVDVLTKQIAQLAQEQLVHGVTQPDERRELVAVLRMLPDLERNGDLAEHIARRAARGLGAEMSARSRGLVERMGEVATTIWRSTADAFAERSVTGANYVDDLDDELDDLHVTLTAELVAGTMPLPVAIELAMVARFYERFGDHAVNLARRMAALVTGGPDPGTSGAD
jgi:phosphate transport system protein